jgi:hypothetical protein
LSRPALSHVHQLLLRISRGDQRQERIVRVGEQLRLGITADCALSWESEEGEAPLLLQLDVQPRPRVCVRASPAVLVSRGLPIHLDRWFELALGQVLELGRGRHLFLRRRDETSQQRIWSHGYLEARIEEELLRFLEDRMVQRIGALTPREVDVPILRAGVLDRDRKVVTLPCAPHHVLPEES